MDMPSTPSNPPAPPPAFTEAPPPARFERLRPPVLGFAVETEPAGGRCRLVAVDAVGPPIAEGSLEECEARLVEVLRARHGNGKLNLPIATLGGKQLWGDVFLQRGWRIQENVLTGHFRLLDPDDVRRAWGAYEGCRVAFEEARLRQGIRPRSERVVVLLHGLGRSKDSFRALREALDREGYEVAALNYPSTRRSVREHSEAIAKVLDRLEGAKEVSFVTHSLGGIVARDLLSLDRPWRQRVKVQRLVMLAPPSRGSAIAEALSDWLPYQLATGDVGQELTPEGAAQIPLPHCEFGIIAGSWGEARKLNPLLEGDHDGVVTVEEARLPGAADFLVVPASHTFIMQNEACIEATLRFLRTGRFQEDGRI
jgi:pimeloyl-ACP methyl ester carboxylesterase